MKRKVVISGVGQLGCRHLEGLSRAKTPLLISVIDPSSDAIDKALRSWEKIGGHRGPHKICTDEPPAGPVDVAIISSTSKHRLAAMRSVLDYGPVNQWILEKPLAQSIKQLDSIFALSGSEAYVNTARRTMDWHSRIAATIRSQVSGPFNIHIEGGDWRMASNILHQVDLARWWTNEEAVEIDLSALERNWVPSKRAGYSEIFGKIRVVFSGGSVLHLSCHQSPSPLTHSFTTTEGTARLRESDGIFYPVVGNAIEGRIEYQSEMTGNVVDQILESGRCSLPQIDDIIQTERLILSAFIDHRGAHGGDGSTLDVT